MVDGGSSSPEAMTKAQRLAIEEPIRAALGVEFACSPTCKVLKLSNATRHEYDIFAAGKVIGGVTTGTFRTSKGNANNASRDRAVAELFWLQLWSGPEQRTHVATDGALASWLVGKFKGVKFVNPILIRRFTPSTGVLETVGTIGVE